MSEWASQEPRKTHSTSTATSIRHASADHLLTTPEANTCLSVSWASATSSFFAYFFIKPNRKADNPEETTIPSAATQAQMAKPTASPRDLLASPNQLSIAIRSSYYGIPLNIVQDNLGKLGKQGDRTPLVYLDGPRTGATNGPLIGYREHATAVRAKLTELEAETRRLDAELREAVKDSSDARCAIEQYKTGMPAAVRSDKSMLSGVTRDWFRKERVLLEHARELEERVRRLREVGRKVGLPGWFLGRALDQDVTDEWV